MEIGAILYAYLEYIIGGLGGIGVVAFIATRKTHDHSNDLTTMVVKLDRHKDAISKRTK